MKLTPIPEKIDSKYTADYGFLVDYINSLIDVTTEQQKRLDEMDLRVLSLEEGQEAHGEWHENNRVEDLIPTVNKMQDMITTIKYCKCKNPDWYSGSCKRCTKPIKSKEDIDKFVDYSINKYKKTYKALGKSQEDIREKIAKYLFYEVWVKQNIVWEKQVFGVKDEWYEKADRILAIVKGE